MENKIKIEIDGTILEKYFDFCLNKSIESFCNSFSFSISQKTADLLEIQQYSVVQITIEKELVFTGFVESIDITQNLDNYYLSISGRDKASEILDSYIIPKQYKQNDFLKLARLVLDDNGFNNIKVESDIKILPKLIGNSFVAEKDSKIFNFLDNLAKTIQVILVTNQNGDLLITREGVDLAVGSIDITNNQINIISSNLNVDSTETYRYIRIIGTQKQEQTKKRFNQNVEFVDQKANTNKRLIVSLGSNSNKNRLEDIANWYMAVKRGKGARYTAEVRGFLTNINSGLLWKENTLILLKDDSNNINGCFLLQGVNYKVNDSGSITTLFLCNVGSFTSFDNNPILSNSVSKFFKTFTGDLASKYR